MTDTRLVVVATGPQGPPGTFRLMELAPWSSTTAYRPGQLVVSGEIIYVAVAGSTNALPATNPTVWQALDLETHEGAQTKADAALAAATVYTDTARGVAEAYADTKVTAEASARTAGDVGTLASAESFTSTAVSVEATTRANNDATTLVSAEAYADAVSAGGDEAVLSTVYARLDFVNGVPTMTTVDLIGLSSADEYIGPTVVPPDVAEIVMDVSGKLFLASPATTALQRLDEKDQPYGYPGLDSAGHVLITVLPALAIGDTFVVHSQAAMLALVAQRGDVAVRDDIDPKGPITFRLAADDPTILANWKQLNYPGDVVTVNGRSGVVIGLAEQTDLTAEVTRATGQENANAAAIAVNSAAIAAIPDPIMTSLIYG